MSSQINDRSRSHRILELFFEFRCFFLVSYIVFFMLGNLRFSLFDECRVLNSKFSWGCGILNTSSSISCSKKTILGLWSYHSVWVENRFVRTKFLNNKWCINFTTIVATIYFSRNKRKKIWRTELVSNAIVYCCANVLVTTIAAPQSNRDALTERKSN